MLRRLEFASDKVMEISHVIALDEQLSIKHFIVKNQNFLPEASEKILISPIKLSFMPNMLLPIVTSKSPLLSMGSDCNQRLLYQIKIVDDMEGKAVLNNSSDSTCLFMLGEIIAGIFELSDKTGVKIDSISPSISHNTLQISMDLSSLNIKEILGAALCFPVAISYLLYSRSLTVAYSSVEWFSQGNQLLEKLLTATE